MAVRLEAAPQQAGPRQRFRYTLPGAWVALVFSCLAFTPSLLPRGALLQGIVCGISAAIGYGVGVAGAWVWRGFPRPAPRPGRAGGRAGVAPPAAARALGGVAVAVGPGLVARGRLLKGLGGLAGRSFWVGSGATAEGVEQP